MLQSDIGPIDNWAAFDQHLTNDSRVIFVVPRASQLFCSFQKHLAQKHLYYQD